MRIAVGSDHAGYLLKDFLSVRLAELGHDGDSTGSGSRRSSCSMGVELGKRGKR
jgi:hypothetical protein